MGGGRFTDAAGEEKGGAREARAHLFMEFTSFAATNMPSTPDEYVRENIEPTLTKGLAELCARGLRTRARGSPNGSKQTSRRLQSLSALTSLKKLDLHRCSSLTALHTDLSARSLAGLEVENLPRRVHLGPAGVGGRRAQELSQCPSWRQPGARVQITGAPTPLISSERPRRHGRSLACRSFRAQVHCHPGRSLWKTGSVVCLSGSRPGRQS